MTHRDSSIGLLVASALCFAASPSFAQPVGGLSRPAGAENRTSMLAISKPEAVARTMNAALGREVVSGSSDADAVNAAAKDLRDAGESDARFVRTQSGLGIVAVGSAVVGDEAGATNEDMKALIRRHARQKAWLAAKSEIAKLLDATRLEGRQELAKQRQLLDDATGSAARPAESPDESLDERVREVVSAFLRGVVLYDVTEVGGKSLVTAVTTPRSQGDVCFASAQSLVARDLQAAKDLVLSEIRTGVVPPSGGRVLTIVGSGTQVVWIAWGCELLTRNPDPKLQAAARTAAETASRLSADAALLALLKGERVSQEQKFKERFEDFDRQFDATLGQAGDPPDSRMTRFDTTRRELLRQFEQTDAMKSVVNGVLPSGVDRDRLLSEDSRWIYTIALYSPDASGSVASSLWPKIKEQNPLGHSDRRAGSYLVKPDGTFEVKDGKLRPQSLGSGPVANPKDL